MYTAPSEGQLSLNKFGTESEVNKCRKSKKTSVENLGEGLHLVGKKVNAASIPIL